ncbi:zinc transporter 4, chloroplastic isoform X1 [Selaginella moellendorffii]|nr:zinc transporter 4, chloroplastic isoform X1 [Selaginella moellendorffii]|eukprot:XP_024523334.1 zinc transporter 4, chloroplastic isoform X1 [Selaginella moellendorffii]
MIAGRNWPIALVRDDIRNKFNLGEEKMISLPSNILLRVLGPCLLNLPERILDAAGTVRTAAAAMCESDGDGGCRNEGEALFLKILAMVTILVTGVMGVALPLLGKRLTCLRTDRGFFLIAKALAAGVILATAFVHILPDAMLVLQSECLPEIPWKRFPFGGFIAMFSAMATLVVDLLSTGFFERRHHKHASSSSLEDQDLDVEAGAESNGSQPKLHIVGMHAHAASHSHSHPQGLHGKELGFEHLGHAHSASFSDEDDEFARIRHIIISQVLELGIITHSIIIGLSLGVSQSPCTIRPLLGALSFHQFFEGFALGGCISQAGFKPLSVVIMAVFFAITTPGGIAIGIGISEVYNPKSVKALVVEGVFYSVSAGILVYMALVNLIAADFLSKRMRCDHRLQTLSLLSLFTGATLMSLLAFWV